ncbi:PepSY domain-containing protein [Streptomyces lycii]|uniref:PepSY domain-containing protein n=1 Tax=Streptomyces lycii TaxID=2654337 RepID=A0ABQ7FNS2_9ACTN|nr:PepSY domain-containing protein [Streptomyces lycii]KAF4409431.1 PepSY domain-containing protein [Streptomyces lycii]
MKRNIVIAAVTAAVLIGGGTATAVAVAGDDTPERLSAEDNRVTLQDARTDLKGAVDAALEHTPGTAVSADFDDSAWEVEISDKNGKEHELTVDAKTGKVTSGDRDDTRDDDRDDDRDDTRADDRGEDRTDDRGDDRGDDQADGDESDDHDDDRDDRDDRDDDNESDDRTDDN